MISDYVMPKLAMAMNEGTINEWLVADGAPVAKGAPIMVVETEKVSYDVESPLDGFLHIIVPVGETVPVETLVGKIASTEEELQSLQGDSAPAQEIAATSAATTVAARALIACSSAKRSRSRPENQGIPPGEKTRRRCGPGSARHQRQRPGWPYR